MRLSPRYSQARTSWAALLLCLFCGAPLFAQSAPQAEKSPTNDAEVAAMAPAVSGGVTIEGRYFPPPMTGKERWDKYVQDTFTGFPIYAASLGAAVGDQASNTPKPWGRNFGGYAKRSGSEYAGFAIQTSVYQGGSALLHNEGRYVACQCDGGWHRAGYAFEMSFLTYHNHRKVLDAPQIVAAYAGGMIPVLWYPSGYSVSAQGVQNGTYQLGFVVLVREIQEFSPELKHLFGHFKP